MVELRILGSPSLVGPDGHEARSVLQQPKRLALLTYLALTSYGSFQRRDRILGVFWPDSPEDKARASLATALVRLRDALGADVTVKRGRGEIGIDPAALSCDAGEFLEAVEAEEWHRAVEAYHGPLLDGFFLDGCPEFDVWLEHTRAHLQRTVVSALGRLTEEAIAAGDDAARALAERAYEINPLDGGAVRRLIEVLARAGQRDAALGVYETYAAKLRDDRGIEASPETIILVQDVREGRLGREPSSKETVEAPDVSPTGDDPVPSSPPSEVVDRLNAGLEGRYKIERELGEGGMATVYLATDVRHERRVALKVLRAELAATMGPQRFLQEVRVTANLQHPHILPLFDSGEADGFLYYAMPYVEGESLRERLARENELPVAEAVKIMREVVDALAAAHQMGVVHRDIKPDNVMLSGRHAVVTDFGVAKAVSEATGVHRLTTAGVALGTPSYMAPEQAAADEKIDHRADIYAVGAIGYELLAGRPPFSGMTPQRVLSAHVTEVPQDVTEHRAAVPPQLGSVIMRCLEKKPADRWQTAEELLRQLEVFATPSTGVTPTQSLPTGAARAVTTGTAMWMKVAAPVALAAVLAIVWFGGREPAVEADGAGGATAATTDVPRFQFAVAPFENLSDVDSLEVFGSIMADYLTGQISRNGIAPVAPAAVVRGLTASRPAGTAVVSYFAEETGAAHVITGTYYTQGGSLVIQAEVVPTDGSQPISVDPVEAPLTSFMNAAHSAGEVLLGVAARIVDPLQPPAAVVGQARSWAAYQKYAEALEIWMFDLPRAHELLLEAIEEDSTFAEAYVQAAVTEWNLHGQLSFTVDSLVQLAARYQDDLAPFDEALLQWIQAWVRGDVEGTFRASTVMERLGAPAGRLCREGLRANQLTSAVRDCLRWVSEPERAARAASFAWWRDLLSALHLLGDHEDELEQARAARSFFPDSLRGVTWEIRALSALEQVDDVPALLDTLRARQSEQGWGLEDGMRLAAEYLYAYGNNQLAAEANGEAIAGYERENPGSESHARALYQGGDYEGARAILERLVEEDPDGVSVLGLAGVVAAKLGDAARVTEIDARLEELAREPYVLGLPTRWRAAIAAELGDLDGAVDLLDQAYDEGNGFDAYLRTDAVFAALQGHRRFEQWMVPR